LLRVLADISEVSDAKYIWGVESTEWLIEQAGGVAGLASLSLSSFSLGFRFSRASFENIIDTGKS
jgi:hypothetical protein